MNSFIFDEDKILKNKIYPQFKLNQNVFCYGLLLPKEIPTYNKKNEILGKEQVWSPAIITSKKEFLEHSKGLELKNKIKFNSVPQHLPLRWSLESIKSYLGEEDGVPDLTPKELAEKINPQCAAIMRVI